MSFPLHALNKSEL